MEKEIVPVIRVLKKTYPGKGMMDLGNPEDTLIATILSARTRDTQVLKVYPGFRKKFPTLASLAKADPSDIAAAISSIGFYHNKAKSISGVAKRLVAEYGGAVPSNMDDLLTLPGVGRKTANCVRAFAFNQPAVCVDTHVFRVTHRLGWTKGKTPERVEQDLIRLVPKKIWSDVNRTMVQFGRDVCQPIKPQCWRCPVAKWCPFEPKTKK